MSQVCKVCRSPDREYIEACLRAGDSLVDISRQSDISRHSLRRHRDNHPILEEEDALAVSRAEDLAEQIAALHEKTLVLLERAESAGQLRTALQAVKEARANIEMQHKLYAAGDIESRLEDLEARLLDEVGLYG